MLSFKVTTTAMDPYNIIGLTAFQLKLKTQEGVYHLALPPSCYSLNHIVHCFLTH